MCQCITLSFHIVIIVHFDFCASRGILEGMQIQIVDEAHNRVDWVVRTPLLKILLGLLIAWAVFVVVLVPTPSPRRWGVLGGVTGVLLLAFAVLVTTTPLGEQGHMERTIEGGDLSRVKRWLIVGRRVAWESPLGEVAGFQMEWRMFEETGAHTYTLARLWATLTDGTFALLTDWADPETVYALGETLAKAGRRSFEDAL